MGSAAGAGVFARSAGIYRAESRHSRVAEFKTFARAARSLATPEPSPTRTPPREPAQYDNYDLAGNDLEHFASDSPGTCLSACRDNSQCRGATFDKWNKVYFLKGEGKTLWFNAHGVSAFIDPDTTPQYADAPMQILHVPGRGFPRAGGTTYASSADACEESCRTTSWCAADTRSFDPAMNA